jgi:hypothetical protein
VALRSEIVKFSASGWPGGEWLSEVKYAEEENGPGNHQAFIFIFSDNWAS